MSPTQMAAGYYRTLAAINDRVRMIEQEREGYKEEMLRLAGFREASYTRAGKAEMKRLYERKLELKREASRGNIAPMSIGGNSIADALENLTDSMGGLSTNDA